MNKLQQTRKKGINTLIAISIIGVAVYLGFDPLFDRIGGGVAGAVVGASFGAIFVIVLTMYLLNKQTEIEQESKKSERIFDEKVTLYKSILLETERMLQDGKIKGHEELKKLPFLMLRLQMLGNDDAIKSFQKIYKEINNIFEAQPDEEEVEINQEASSTILDNLGEFSNVCRLDLGVSDETIDLKLSKEISKDVRQSNEITNPNANIIGIHEEILKRDKDIKFKTVNRDYLSWQRENWPTKVEFQVITRIRKKIYFVQLGAESKSGKYIADQMHNLLPVFKSKIPQANWSIGKWYADYDNRIYATFDINDSSKAAEVFVKMVNEIQKDVEMLISGSS